MQEVCIGCFHCHINFNFTSDMREHGLCCTAGLSPLQTGKCWPMAPQPYPPFQGGICPKEMSDRQIAEVIFGFCTSWSRHPSEMKTIFKHQSKVSGVMETVSVVSCRGWLQATAFPLVAFVSSLWGWKARFLSLAFDAPASLCHSQGTAFPIICGRSWYKVDWRGTGIYLPPPAFSRLELKLFSKLLFISYLFYLCNM